MQPRLDDFSPATLVRANRANLYEFFGLFENSPGMEFTRSDGFLRWSSPFQYSWFNAMLCQRNAAPGDEAFIDASLAYFRAKNTYEISCWLEDGVDLPGWQALLKPRGFRFVKGPPGMSVDLQKLSKDLALPGDAHVRVVDDEQSLRDCAHVITLGYGFPAGWEGLALDFVRGLGQPYRSYMLYWQDKPVATAGFLFGSEVTGVFSVATLPEARGRGFGGAITLAGLLDARQMGYRIGTLQASEMGFPVYKRLGFKQDFTASSFFLTL